MSLLIKESDERGVVTLTLNRPEVRNAFNHELIDEITNTFKSIGDGERVIVLAGEGKAFCAGADLGWMRSIKGYTREENITDSSGLRDMFDSIDRCPVPVIGRVHGAAIAGATGLIACCDFVVASEETQFAFTETRLGLIPAVISPYVIRKVGYSFARAMFLSAQGFNAKRAQEVGLVHRVVPSDELDEAVADVVTAFLTNGPHAVSATRDLIEAVLGKSPADVANYTVEAIAKVRSSEEGQEGVAAFLEKRQPTWAPPKD